MKDFFSNIFKKATDFISEQAQNLEKLKDNVVEHLENMKQQEEEKNKPQVFEQIQAGADTLQFKLPDGSILTINSPAYASYNNRNFYHYDFTEIGVKTYSLSKESADDKGFSKLTVVDAPFDKWRDWGEQRVNWEGSWVEISVASDVQSQTYTKGSSDVKISGCSYLGLTFNFGHLSSEKPRDFEACYALWDYIESKLPASMQEVFQAGKAFREASLAEAISRYEDHLQTKAYYEKMDVIMAERKQELIDAGEWVEPEQESYSQSMSSSSSSSSKKVEKTTQEATTKVSKAKNIDIKIKNDTDEPFTVYNQGSGGYYRLAKNVTTTIKMDEGDKLFYYEGGKKGHLILTASPEMEGKVQNYSKL